MHGLIRAGHVGGAIAEAPDPARDGAVGVRARVEESAGQAGAARTEPSDRFGVARGGGASADEEEVVACGARVRDHAEAQRSGEGIDGLLRGSVGVLVQIQGGRSGDMGSRHGSAAHDPAAVHGAGRGRRNRVAGGEPVEAVAEIGIVGPLVVFGRRADRHALGDTGGREAAGVGAAVAGRHRGHETGLVEAAHGVIDQVVALASERQVHHARPGAVGQDPLDPGEHRAGGSRAIVVEDPDGDEVDVLGDAPGGPPDRPGDVSAVSMAIRSAAAEGIESDPGTAAGGKSMPVSTM